MRVLAKFKEPLKGYEQKFVMVSIEELSIIEIQRKPSTYHVRRLAESMRKIGFITPMIAIEKDGKCIVIDGQHRLLAAKEAGVSELPCIIIPERYAHDLMELNIEKQMSLREKAYVALNVYRMYLGEDDSIPEDDPRILDSIEFPYYITLGVAYERNEKLYGSAYESILRRVDRFLSLPLGEAMGEREKKAEMVIEADRLTREATEKVKEIGITHPFIHREVVSFCSPIGRKRKLDLTLEEVFKQLQENLKKLIEQPERIREHKFSEMTYES
ncbi:MAG: ParB/RepB/Spo0J family partition protein [Candidatus Methanospirareceae archaeon]